MTVTGAAQSRVFDAENRLVQVSVGGTVSEFIYDADGQRLIKSVAVGDSLPTRTLYIGSLYEEELGSKDPPYISYYQFGGKLIGMRRVNQVASNGQYRMVGDQLSSTTVVVDTSTPSQIVQRQYYKPYGAVAWQYTAASSLTSVNFTSQRLDSDSGLLYYGGRFYDPILSYFTSPDPTVTDRSIPTDFNRYLYVRSNPLLYVDTSGYSPEDYYVFVNGCVTGGCSDDPNIGGFGEYGELLFDLFVNSWGRDEASWGQWTKEHLLTLGVGRGNLDMDPAGALNEAADKINGMLSRIKGDADIHLLGTSQGGAALLQYFANSGGAPSQYTGKRYQVDARIASFTTIDSPLNDVTNMPANITSFLTANTRIKISPHATESALYEADTALNVDDSIDSVGHDQIGDIYHMTNPIYPCKGGQCPSNFGWDRHIWTTTHVATQTERFLRRVWN